MKRLFSIIILVLSVTSCAVAQRDNTIYETLATNVILSAGGFDDYGPVTNIGQGYHQFYLNVSNQIGKNCSGGSSVFGGPTSTGVSFYVQPPGTTFKTYLNTTIESTTPGGGVGFGIVGSAQSIFPYIFIEISKIDRVNCQYSLIYSGSLYPSVPGTLNVSQNVLGGGGTGGPSVQAFIQSRVSVAVVGPTTVIANGTDPASAGSVSQNIFGLIIANSTASQTVTLNCGAGVLQVFAGLTAGQVIVLPVTGNAYYYCGNLSTNNVSVTLANATAVDFNFFYKTVQ